MSSYSYVALITPKEKLPIAMSLCEGSWLCGNVLGFLINGPIIDATSLATMGYINAGLSTLPLVIVLVFVKDVVHADGIVYSWKDFIGLNHLLDAIKCVTKTRQGYDRMLILTSSISFATAFLALDGFLSVEFLYFVKERGMSMT